MTSDQSLTTEVFMKRILLALIVVFISFSAWAGGNPYLDNSTTLRWTEIGVFIGPDQVNDVSYTAGFVQRFPNTNDVGTLVREINVTTKETHYFDMQVDCVNGLWIGAEVRVGNDGKLHRDEGPYVAQRIVINSVAAHLSFLICPAL